MLTRILFCPFTLADIAKHNHATNGIPSEILDRRAGILYRKAGSVLFPKDIIVDKAGRAVLIGRIDRTFMPGKVGAVSFGMMKNLMLVGTNQLISAPTGDLLHSSIHKGRITFEIHSIDAIRHRIKNQLISLFKM